MSGRLCISIDVELGWGVWDRPSGEYMARCAASERDIVRALLIAFERHDVSATWAIVGRLLVPGRPPANDFGYGQKVWYAPDLVEAIRRGRPDQDIGSHTHEHSYFQQVGFDVATEDLEAARRVHDDNGLSFASFVFPRNQVNHIGALRAAGVRVFRSVDRGWYVDVRSKFGASAGRAANLVDKMLPLSPQCVEPHDHGGIVELPSSMLLMARSGVRRFVPPDVIVEKARRGLVAARNSGKVFHLWFHPSNFYYSGERQLRVLNDILELAGRMRRRGELEIVPMSCFRADRT